MPGFWTALTYVFFAEMGDKSQLLALALASRYRLRTVLGGLFLACLSLHLLSTLLGQTIGLFLPPFWIKVVAGALFLAFGVWMFRDEDGEDEAIQEKSGISAFIHVFVVFFLAELGDKTMIMSATLATQTINWVSVWVGSTFGMFFADGLAVFIGRFLGKQLPQKPMRLTSGVLFILTGAYFLYTAFSNRI